MNEQFSAFLDNETTGDESDAVISALLRDEALRDNWTRQHQIRDVLRTSTEAVDVSVDIDFSARVMQAIHADKQIDAPAFDTPAAVTQGEAKPTTAKVVSLRQPQRRRRGLRSMAGLAVAASAAGVAFFVMQPAQQLTSPDALTPVASQSAPVQATTRVAANTEATPELHFAAADADEGSYNTPWNWAGGLVRTVAARVNQTQQAAGHWSVSDPTLANRLNDFLVEHNGLARGYGLSATTPGFVRAATYGQDFAQ